MKSLAAAGVVKSPPELSLFQEQVLQSFMALHEHRQYCSQSVEMGGSVAWPSPITLESIKGHLELECDWLPLGARKRFLRCLRALDRAYHKWYSEKHSQ